MNGYLPRVVDPLIEEGISTAGALVIHGARAVGKTASARRVAASELRLDTSDPRAALAREQPATALEGDTPRLIDEWQLIPQVWNEVRHAVDERRSPGQFLLSGSATPDDHVRRHSGAGRFRRILMRTMSLAETDHSTAAVSLRSLLSADADIGLHESAADFATVVRRIVVGGWPGWWENDEQAARTRVRSYIEDLTEHDFPQVAGSRRDPRRLGAFLRAVAALSAQPAAYTTISRRIHEESSLSVTSGGIPTLHDFAERMFVIEDQPAWSPRLRSRTASLQTAKRHLVDPSLAASLLDAGTDRLLAEPETLGFLFESQVVHDLRVYADAIGCRGVFHYRDSKGRDEIDAVVEADDGSWIAVEVKLGASSVDAAAANLRRVTDKALRAPTSLVVVVPTGIAHRRSDGVYVVPLTTLGL